MPELLEPGLREESLVPDPITGTNTEKIDQLAAAVADLRVQVGEIKTALRLIGWVAALVVPSIISLNVFLVYSVVTMAADLRTISAQLQRIETVQKDTDRELRDHQNRITTLEAAAKK